VNERNQFFTPGLYLVKLKGVDIIKNAKQTVKIVGEIFAVKNQEDGPAVGESAAQIFSTAGSPKDEELGIKNLMQFVTSIFKCDPEDKTREEWESIIESIVDDHDLDGEFLMLECFEITTQKGNPFTIHTWGGLATDDDFTKFGITRP